MASEPITPESAEGSFLPRAANVCLACKRRKKKCGKELPKCLHCKKHHFDCVYEDTGSVPIIEEFRQLRKRLKLFENLLVPGSSKTSDLLSLPSSQAFMKYPTPSNICNDRATLTERLQKLHVMSSVGEEVYKLLQSKPGEVYGVCQIYFQNIHKWMPILPQKLFYRRMTEFSRTKRPEFAVLLLSVFLLIHNPGNGSIPEELYKTVREIYWHLNASADASIELIQAGILISCYEYGSGMIEQCYKTVRLCTTLCYLMGIHEAEGSIPTAEGDEGWIKVAERQNAWWALVIRDRFLIIPGDTSAKPFAIDPQFMPNKHPFEASDLDACFVNSSTDGVTGIFGRQAEACRLLDEAVRSHYKIGTEKKICDKNGKDHLDQELRQLMRTLIDQNGGVACGYCEPSSMVLASIFFLHTQHVSAGSTGATPNEDAVASSFALKTAVRMVIDIARSLNDLRHQFNFLSFPPTYTHVIYWATVELISFHDDMDRSEWSAGVEALRAAIWNYSQRWQAAAKYLNAVDEALANLAYSPRGFNLFQPLLNDSSLVTLLN